MRHLMSAPPMAILFQFIAIIVRKTMGIVAAGGKPLTTGTIDRPRDAATTTAAQNPTRRADSRYADMDRHDAA